MPGDKTWEYVVQDGQWMTRKVGTDRFIPIASLNLKDMMAAEAKLESAFPGKSDVPLSFKAPEEEEFPFTFKAPEVEPEAMEFPFGYHQEAHTYGMNQEIKFTWHYRGMINKLELRKMLKNHPDFKDYYITLNELDVILKKISTKWPNGEWTKQIVLDNHKRIRVIVLIP